MGGRGSWHLPTPPHPNKKKRILSKKKSPNKKKKIKV
jgi:hypothetical protein